MPMLEEGTLRKLYKEFQTAIAVCAVVLFMLAVVHVPNLTGDVFPAAFRRSSPVILVLMPAGLCALVNFPLTILVLLFTRSRFLVQLDCALLPVLLLAYLWVIPLYGVIGAAAVTTTAALGKKTVMQITALLQAQEPRSSIESLSAPLHVDEVPDAS